MSTSGHENQVDFCCFCIRIILIEQNTSSDRILLENVIEKSVQFRNNIRDINRRRRSSTEEDNSKKLLLEQCDDYRLQMKYLGIEIKVFI